MTSYEIARVDELPDIDYRDDTHMRPVRHHFGITAFGTNAWTAENVGDRLMPEHEEDEGNEELYVVLRGRARFEIDGESVDAPQGTLVFVRPGGNRTAFAEEAGTTVLAVGSKVGKAYPAGGWEVWAPFETAYRAGDYAGVVERAREPLEASAERLGALQPRVLRGARRDEGRRDRPPPDRVRAAAGASATSPRRTRISTRSGTSRRSRSSSASSSGERLQLRPGAAEQRYRGERLARRCDEWGGALRRDRATEERGRVTEVGAGPVQVGAGSELPRRRLAEVAELVAAALGVGVAEERRVEQRAVGQRPRPDPGNGDPAQRVVEPVEHDERLAGPEPFPRALRLRRGGGRAASGEHEEHRDEHEAAHHCPNGRARLRRRQVQRFADR